MNNETDFDQFADAARQVFETRRIKCHKCGHETEFVVDPKTSVQITDSDGGYSVGGFVFAVMMGAFLGLVFMGFLSLSIGLAWCCCKMLGGIFG